MRRLEAPQHGWHEVANVGRPSPRPRVVAATRTLRGIRSCSNNSVASTIGSAWKRSTIDAAVDNVAQRHQRHSLMVGHVAADDGHRLALGKPPGGVVEGFTKSVAPGAPTFAKRAKLRDRGLRIDHRGERRGVWGDHDVLAEPALQAEAGYTEARVLIGLGEVAGVETRFGDAPRHAQLGCVLDLPGDDQSIGLLEQAVRQVRA